MCSFALNTQALTNPEKEKACQVLLHTINWMRELLNQFATQVSTCTSFSYNKFPLHIHLGWSSITCIHVLSLFQQH